MSEDVLRVGLIYDKENRYHVWEHYAKGSHAIMPWSMYEHLRDYAKCYVKNNEALQKENAELRARVIELEELTSMLLND
jgi:hypothetical protein